MTLQTVRLDHLSCRIGMPPSHSQQKGLQRSTKKSSLLGNFLNPGGGIIVEPTAKGFVPIDGTHRWSPWTSPATCSSAGERPLASRFRLEVFLSITRAEYINHYIPMWDGQIPLQQSFPIISSWEMF